MDKDVLRVFFFKQKTAYEVRISDWSSDVCSSELEGIGQGRITANLEGITPDDAFQIPDEEALPVVFDLLQHEGLVLGGSTGINVAAAIRLAKQMGPGHTIVTILADGGARYQSKMFNPDFLRSKNLPVPAWMN